MRISESIVVIFALVFMGCGPAPGAAPATPSIPPAAAPADAAPEAAPKASQVEQIEHAKGRTEVGVIEGAPYRIDIPTKWNGGLVIFCHGYGGPPKPFVADSPSSHADTYGLDGFAVAQSANSAGGYAITEAAEDNEALRRYFIARFGVPRETWITGESLGGMLTMILMETHPKAYDGGLPMCAPLGPAVGYIKTVVFDPLVLFELWFPNELPSPAAVPADYVMKIERAEHITRLLDANPTRAAALRARSSVRTNGELARLLDLYTYILGELAVRAGGNAFDNRDTVYTNVGDDEAVNDGVKRYAADPKAQRMLITHYTPTGRIDKPVLHVRTVYDPLISAWSSERYTELTQLAGTSDLFAQKYVKGAGHCELRPEERRAALQELRRWKEKGERPAPGLVKVPGEGASAP